ncbi:uncharacterized protein LOC134719588 [Mytilus trossulus]|uniref:uncharacterized protein LOC134719588 n=1 Tax=Mytilus trossulus TaxID=6551 RepID=UPI00300479DF
MSIIVGVLLRKRYKTISLQQPSKENNTTNRTPRTDTTQGTQEPEINQRANLMNSSDANHVSPSHAVNLEISTDVSNTYSHLRNAVDDSDVMYDHTIRNNVHDTTDGDYGIAHRRITEDDYDVSGNYRHSLSKEADPVYN